MGGQQTSSDPLGIATADWNPFHTMQAQQDRSKDQFSQSQQQQKNFMQNYTDFANRYRQGIGNNAQDYGNLANQFASQYAGNVASGAQQQAQNASRTAGMTPAQAALMGANTSAGAYGGAYGQGTNAYQNYLAGLGQQAATGMQGAVGAMAPTNEALGNVGKANTDMTNFLGSIGSSLSDIFGFGGGGKK